MPAAAIVADEQERARAHRRVRSADQHRQRGRLRRPDRPGGLLRQQVGPLQGPLGQGQTTLPKRPYLASAASDVSKVRRSSMA